MLQSAAAAAASLPATQPEAALAAALKLARKPDQPPALAERLQLALPDLKRQAQSKGRTVLARYAQLAAAVPAALATELCTPFDWRQLRPADTRALAPLQAVHGVDWLVALLRQWAAATPPHRVWAWTARTHEAAHDERGNDSDSDNDNDSDNDSNNPGQAADLWPQPLPAFLAAGDAAQWSPAALDEVVTQALRLQNAVDASPATPAQRLAAWPARLRAVCQLAQAVQCLPQPPLVMQQLRMLLDRVAAQPLLYPPRTLLSLLQVLSSTDVVAAPERLALLERTRAALQAGLDAALPASDDHGLHHQPWVCRCADCKPALQWAESASAVPLQLALALAEARRSHVQTALQDAAAPLLFTTLKQGSPYKLVLAKQAGLHAERLRLRSRWAADLAALNDLPTEGCAR